MFGVARAGGSPFKINAAGTNGYGPSAVQGTASVIYQQVGRSSNLYYFNMTTHVRSPLVLQVNTPAWEYYGVGSKRYVAFMRLTATGRTLVLYDKATRVGHKIATTTKSCNWCLRPNWVGGSHLVYTQCSASTDTCQVRVLTIGGQTVTVPRGAVPYSNYSGSMDEATGDVYYISSTKWCGLFVSLNRWNVNGTAAPVSMYDLPEGIDGNNLSLAPNATTPTDEDMLFSQYDCLTDNSDNFQIESVKPVHRLRCRTTLGQLAQVGRWWASGQRSWQEPRRRADQGRTGAGVKPAPAAPPLSAVAAGRHRSPRTPLAARPRSSGRPGCRSPGLAPALPARPVRAQARRPRAART